MIIQEIISFHIPGRVISGAKTEFSSSIPTVDDVRVQGKKQAVSLLNRLLTISLRAEGTPVPLARDQAAFRRSSSAGATAASSRRPSLGAGKDLQLQTDGLLHTPPASQRVILIFIFFFNPRLAQQYGFSYPKTHQGGCFSYDQNVAVCRREGHGPAAG